MAQTHIQVDRNNAGETTSAGRQGDVFVRSVGLQEVMSV